MPPPANWEELRTVTKEVEDAVEGFGRASSVIRSWLGLAIYEDPLGSDGKKKPWVAPSYELQTFTV